MNVDIFSLRKPQRLKRVQFEPETLAFGFPVNADMTFECVRNLVPPDAKVVGAGYDHMINQLYCLVEHSSFEEIGEGECIPVLPPAQFLVHGAVKTAE